MSKKYKVVFIILLTIAAAIFTALLMLKSNAVVLNPKGVIAQKERELMIRVTGMMLIVVIPVFILTFIFAWKYRENNAQAKYAPDWDHHHISEIIWWGLPLAIILVLSIMTWKSSHELDPFQPLDSPRKPLIIQVVALQWKWLFIYPEQNIATVNFVQFPEQTPIHFEITADAPMNSFWIPQLGGQVYAMPGMKTQLHLLANEVGSFRGSSANLSGRGFAGMTFIAKACTQEEFLQWVQSIQQSPNFLSLDAYNQLSEPSVDHPVTTYQLTAESLYEQIVMKFMAPMR